MLESIITSVGVAMRRLELMAWPLGMCLLVGSLVAFLCYIMAVPVWAAHGVLVCGA